MFCPHRSLHRLCEYPRRAMEIKTPGQWWSILTVMSIWRKYGRILPYFRQILITVKILHHCPGVFISIALRGYSQRRWRLRWGQNIKQIYRCTELPFRSLSSIIWYFLVKWSPLICWIRVLIMSLASSKGTASNINRVIQDWGWKSPLFKARVRQYYHMIPSLRLFEVLWKHF